MLYMDSFNNTKIVFDCLTGESKSILLTEEEKRQKEIDTQFAIEQENSVQDPVSKLSEFLDANPDVKELLFKETNNE